MGVSGGQRLTNAGTCGTHCQDGFGAKASFSISRVGRAYGVRDFSPEAAGQKKRASLGVYYYTTFA